MGFLQPDALAPADGEKDVEPGAEGDDGEAQAQRQRKAEEEMDAEHRTRLANDGQPAQPHQRAEPEHADFDIAGARFRKKRPAAFGARS
jgi:hypothetical protein